ncbi:hypothetical protein LTR35_007041 [Friedmanniomyces endolithicus]|nr:hypothetical protein LTR35_007041 [Friedmanniomyces endolithicus]
MAGHNSKTRYSPSVASCLVQDHQTLDLMVGNDLHCTHLRIDNYNDGAVRQLHVLWQRSIELQHDMYLKHNFKLRSAGHFHIQVLGLCERYAHQRLHEPMFDCISHDKLRQIYLAGFCTGGHDKLH